MLEPNHWQALGWIAVAIFALAGGVNQVVRLVDRFKGHPPVEHLQLNAMEIARRVESLERLTADSINHRSEINDDIKSVKDELREETRRDLGEIYARIHTLGESVAGLNRDTEHTSRQLAHIDNKLDRVIERLAARSTA